LEPYCLVNFKDDDSADLPASSSDSESCEGSISDFNYRSNSDSDIDIDSDSDAESMPGLLVGTTLIATTTLAVMMTLYFQRMYPPWIQERGLKTLYYIFYGEGAPAGLSQGSD